MKINFHQIYEKTNKVNGYGQARACIEQSLRNLGHQVSFMDPTADLDINFIQPNLAKWSGAPYRILYWPWESTALRPEWLVAAKDVDEVWTTSDWNKQIFEDAGIKKPVRVFKHGVEKIWTPKRRQWSDGPLEFFHHGAEALRKGGNETVFLMMTEFYERQARLTMKMSLKGFKHEDTDKMRVRSEILDLPDLVKMYQDHHAMLYPSWGEGFGLAPLQFMATGGPVVITKGWAPYENLVPEELLVDTSLQPSPRGPKDWRFTNDDWTETHPGKMWQPNMDDYRDKTLHLYNNYERYAETFFNLTETVEREYDWDTLTERAFAHLV